MRSGFLDKNHALYFQVPEIHNKENFEIPHRARLNILQQMLDGETEGQLVSF